MHLYNGLNDKVKLISYKTNKMPIFVIAGRVNCPLFVHAIQIATYLSDHLPDIKINKRELDGEEWQEFLIDINKTHNWHITKSPVIWKEVGFARAKPHLIGGLSELWEYIDDYYGIKTFLNRETVADLCTENLKAYEEKHHMGARRRRKSTVVGLFGFNNDMAHMLLPELFNVPGLFDTKMVTIKIYDPEALRDFEVEEDIRDVLHTFETDLHTDVKFELLFVTTLSYFVENMDLILITDDYSQRNDEDRQAWLKRCSVEICELAREINDTGGDDLKIICSHFGPVCFTATAITKHIKPSLCRNIVAVTAHEGLKALSSVSKITGKSVSTLAAPPVWGFVGLDQFVDVQGIIEIQDIVRPYKRALKDIPNSSLPQMRVRKELRMLSCNVSQKHFENSLMKRRSIYNKLGRKPALPLIRATLHLLEMWYSPNRAAQVVISLGIHSDGNFGIPRNIIFSQPASLSDQNIWVTFDKLPILDESRRQIRNCIEFTADLLDSIVECF